MSEYLRELRWALAALPPQDRDEIVRETESHLAERVAKGDDVAKVMREMGEPRVYAARFVDNYDIAIATASGSGRRMMQSAAKHVGRSIWVFIAFLGFFTFYSLSLGFTAVGVLKLVFPQNVGLWTGNGVGPFALGYMTNAPVGGREHLGYWIIPLALFAGAAIYIATTSALRRFLRSLAR